MPDTISVLIAVGFVVFCVTIYTGKNRSTPAPFPPGPKGFPLLGNITDLPKTQPWVTFSKWGEIYGGIVRVNVLGTNIVVLNDVKYAIDMLDKKSRIYSDRPTLVVAGKLVGWEAGPSLVPYGAIWSEYRRHFARFMGTRSKVDRFQDVLHGESSDFLNRLLKMPDGFIEHSRKFSGSMLLKLTYGYVAKEEGDPLVKLLTEAMDQLSEVTAGSAFFVDVFPILQHIPKSLPGAAWKKKLPIYQETLKDVINTPFDWVSRQIADGIAGPSFLANLLDHRKASEKDESVLKWAAAGLYSGGAESTFSGVVSFFLGMTLQTAAQEKAQREIDDVIGPDRLPTLADRERLPYCDALFTEVLRMYILGPLGFMHAASEDDVHDGYYIPKGSIIVTNIWQYCKDPKAYANPGNFCPERFLETGECSKEKDPRKFLFGFGRRTCPGIHLADASMWLVCISTIAAFNIRPPIKDGKPCPPSGKYGEGLVSHPEPFDCVITPRSPTAAALVRAT